MNNLTIEKEKLYQLHIKTFSYKHLQYFLKYLNFILKSNQIFSISIFPLKKKRITLLRSPHKYKKAQEHFSLNVFIANITIRQSNFYGVLPLIINKPYGTFIKIKILS
jgi:ribosomal protein S10